MTMEIAGAPQCTTFDLTRFCLGIELHLVASPLATFPFQGTLDVRVQEQTGGAGTAKNMHGDKIASLR